MPVAFGATTSEVRQERVGLGEHDATALTADLDPERLSDEGLCLRVGCVRWQREAVPVSGTGDVLPKKAVCLLDVPTNKTGTAFTKPVDRAVGEAIAFWEQVRPPQPATTDAKTGEVVDLLFAHRGARLGNGYMNCTLTQLLCHKAGVPERDAR